MNFNNNENIKKEKKFKNNEFEEIFSNIIEIDTKKEDKRNNSLNEKNMFKNKKNFQYILGKSELKLRENNIKNENKSTSLLMKSEISRLRKNKIFNKKFKDFSEENALNSNSLSKNENNINIQSFINKKSSCEKKSNLSSSSFGRNFILKSDLKKLSEKENSNNQIKNNIELKNNFDCLLTQKIKKQEELNKNQFYKFFFDNKDEENINYQEINKNKNNIISNTYIDEEEELNKENEENENRNNFNLINNYYANCDLSEEIYSLKNLMNSNINLKHDIKNVNNQYKINNNIKFNNKYISFNKIKNEENKMIENRLKENVYNLISNEENKEKEINLNKGKEVNINKNNNIKNFNKNNYINNIYNFQKAKNYSLNFIPKYNNYSVMNLPSYYNKNNFQNQYYYYNPGYFNQNFDEYQNHFSKIYNQYNNNIFNLNINNNNNNNIFNFKKTDEDDKQLAKLSLNLVKSQIGCRILQEKSINDKKFANELLFPELKNNLKEICCDLFGNYLIQILLDILSLDNINEFLSVIQENLFEICLTEHGSRVIQKLLDRIYNSPLLIEKLINSLSNKDIGQLFKSPYANHMIQKYLTIVKEIEFKNFIYDYIYSNFMDIVKSKHGVCVVQKGLSEGNDIQKKKILEIIIDNIDKIMKDCFANFLIQYLFTKFEKRKSEEILPIIEKIEENIVDYCQNKYSASVIEKCFEKGEKKISEHIINNLLEYHSEYIIDIILNSFGLYVIKKALNLKNTNLKEKVRNVIINNIQKIKESNNGIKIIESLSNEYKEFSNLIK